MSLAKSIAARMLARKPASSPERPANAKAAPRTGTEPIRAPERAPRPAQAFTPPRSEPDLRELVEAFAPPPAPTPPPPPVVRPGWRGNCKAINPATGRRCALLEGHDTMHRHGSTAFAFGAEPGQTHFARRELLDALALKRGSFSEELEKKNGAQEKRESRARIGRAHQGANTSTGEKSIDNPTHTHEAA